MLALRHSIVSPSLASRIATAKAVGQLAAGITCRVYRIVRLPVWLLRLRLQPRLGSVTLIYQVVIFANYDCSRFSALAVLLIQCARRCHPPKC